MSLEMELKYIDADHDAVRSCLVSAGAHRQGRWFEENTVYDYPDRRLKKQGVLLRVRKKGDRAALTVKIPPAVKVESSLKVFEELETGIADYYTTCRALEAVGFVPAFAYEKVREKWEMDNCHICIDHLPFGDFVEIEGGEQEVLLCAKRLGLKQSQASTETYHALNLLHRSAEGFDMDESFVFAEAERKHIESQLVKE